MAKQSEFPDEIAEKILERMAGGETLTAICRDDGMPKRRAVYERRSNDADFAARFQEARDEGFDVLAEGCIDIADDKSEDPQSRKVRIHTRMELLKKWDPKRYGELIKQQHSGPNGGPLEFTEIIRKIVK